MCKEKYIVKSCNNLGYLIYIDDKVIFQPNFNNDKMITGYYRINSGNYFNNDYIVSNKIEINNDVKMIIPPSDSKKIIDKVLKYVYQKNDKSTYFNKTEKQIIDNFGDDTLSQVGYIFDHLTYSNKKKLLYTLIKLLKENSEIEKFKYLVDYCKQFFLYYNNSTMEYYYLYDDINIHDLSGFFLFNPNIEQEIHFKVYDDYIEKYSEIDKLHIVSMFENFKKSTIFKTKINWGFTFFSKRFKEKNSIVLKIITKTTIIKKKYKFPKDSPGTVVNSLNSDWTKEATYSYLQELIENYEQLSKDFKNKIEKMYTKDDYTFIIEYYLRKINKIYPYDLIWLNYKFDVIT